MLVKKASELLTATQVSSVETAIAEAELKTSAEIVPVIASTSSDYGRSVGIFAFLFALLSLSLTWGILIKVSLSSAAWGGPGLGVGLLISVVILLLLAFFIGVALAQVFPVLNSPFIPKHEMQTQVELSAHASFQKLRIRRTEGSSGILIYVSIYERMVHVVGDDAVNARLSNADFSSICDTVILGLKDANAEQGLRNALLQCGDLLEQHLPIGDDDKNELANTLHLLD